MTVAKLKVRKIRATSPHPQISFAMYLIGWIEAGTGKQHYQEITTLIQAAFHAAGLYAVASFSGGIDVFMRQNMSTVASWGPGSAQADALAFRPDDLVLAAGYQNTVTFWNLRTRSPEGSLDFSPRNVTAPQPNQISELQRSGEKIEGTIREL